MYGLVRIVAWTIGHLPERLVPPLARVLGSLAYLLSPRRRRIALENLRHARGVGATERECRRIARASFTHLAGVALEFCRLPRMRGRWDERVSREGDERFLEALEPGRGVVLAVSHVGNWEAGGQLLAEHGLRVTALARPLRPAGLDRFVREVREAPGVEVVPARGGLERAVRRLRRGHVVALLIDQFAMRRGASVEFLGRPAPTHRSASVLSIRTGAPLVLGFLVRTGPPGTVRYRSFVEGPIWPDPTADRRAETIRLTVACSRVIERYVREYPEQWLWMHRRWRPYPPYSS